MKNKSLIIWLVVIMFVLNGCQFNDLDKRFFVVAMGIDQSNNEKNPYQVLIKLAIPSAQVQPGKERFQIISQDANSIPEAIRLVQSKVDKKLDFGHCRVIILNKELLHRDQLDLMKWFIKRPDIQGISYIAVGKPSAKDILSWNLESERLPSNALVLAFNEVTNKSPYVIPEILNDYYMRLREEGVDPYLPVIEPIKGSFKIDSSVVLKGRKLGAELNENETSLLNELINPNKTTLIKVGKGSKQFFVNTESTRVKVKIHAPKGRKPYVIVRIKIRGFVEESKESLHNIGEIKEHERLTSTQINLRVENLLERLQALKVDPLGLGLKYQVKHGTSQKVVNEWRAIYPNLEVFVKTDVKLKGTGAMY